MNIKCYKGKITPFGLVILTSILLFSNHAFSLEDLEEQIDATIRQACFGHAVAMLPDALRDSIYENSDTCKAVKNYNGNVAAALASVGQSKLRHPAKWTKARSDVDIGIPCGMEYRCMDIRKRYRDSKTPVSQADFDAVEAHCNGEDHCIQRWFESWPRELPKNIKQLKLEVPAKGAKKGGDFEIIEGPSASVGLGFEELMGSDGGASAIMADDTGPSGSHDGIGFGDLMEDDVKQSGQPANIVAFGESTVANTPEVYSPQVDMDDIYASRSEIKIDSAIDRLKAKVNAIFDNCHCLTTRKACFNGPKFSIADVNVSLRELENKFNHEKDKVCVNWQGIYKNLPRDLGYLNEATSNAETSLAYFNNMDKKFTEVIKKHRSENRRIERAKQAAADSSGGFQLGKFAALGFGAAIGGIGNLDSATQLELFSGMVADSMEGIEGTSNFRGSADSSLARLAPPKAVPLKQPVKVANEFTNVPITQASMQPQPASLSFSCHNEKQDKCYDYIFSNKTEFDEHFTKCQSSDVHRVVSQCRPHPSCKHHNETGSTWQIHLYELNADEVKRNCHSPGVFLP
jgi:hypothetical protein